MLSLLTLTRVRVIIISEGAERERRARDPHTSADDAVDRS